MLDFNRLRDSTGGLHRNRSVKWLCTNQLVSRRRNTLICERFAARQGHPWQQCVGRTRSPWRAVRLLHASSRRRPRSRRPASGISKMQPNTKHGRHYGKILALRCRQSSLQKRPLTGWLHNLVRACRVRYPLVACTSRLAQSPVGPNRALNRTHCGRPSFGLKKPSPNATLPQWAG